MENEISFLKAELVKSKKIYSRLHLKLPDKGAKLLKEIENREEQIKNLQKQVEERKEQNVIKTNRTTSISDNSKYKSASKSEISDNFQSSNVNKPDDSKSSIVMKSKQIGPTSFIKELSFTIKKVEQESTRTLPSEKLSNDVCKEKESKIESLSEEDKNINLVDISGDVFPSDKLSFVQYRDPRNHKAVEIIPAPAINPEKGIKSHKENNHLGSIYKKDPIKNPSVQEATVELRSSLMNFPSLSEEEPDPVDLKTKLLKHQRTALKWLLWRESQIPQGGVFADDMGLGKTLTIISLILKEREISRANEAASKIKENGGTLVVCLTSILHQWNAEIEKHCKENSLNVLIYHGPNRSKLHKQIMNYDIVLTTYDIIRNEGKDFRTKGKQTPLFEMIWYRIILDEAHTIKNYKSQKAEWVCKLKSSRKWAVTGTPIHNDLKDFYCLLKFLQYEPFCDLSIWKKLISDMTEKSVGRRNLLIKNILLRRCKHDIDEKTKQPLIPLPKKKFKIFQLHLSEEEQSIYDDIEKELKEKCLKRRINISNVGASKKNDGIFLTSLLKLQQCCNHLSLLKQPIEDDSINSVDLDMSRNFESLNIKEESSDLSETLQSLNINDSFPSVSDVSLSYVKDFKYDSSQESSKVRKLISKIKKILNDTNGEKCVIVSQWVSMLEIVGYHLKLNNLNFHSINGKTKPEERQLISKDFNYNSTGFPVLLLSLKAGGVGLNLVGGNHLFLMDMHWNPALETQACDRIHRVGQERDVCIYKFICIGTIEEKIFDLQMKKKRLAKIVLDGAKEVSYLSFDDFKRLFET